MRLFSKIILPLTLSVLLSSVTAWAHEPARYATSSLSSYSPVALPLSGVDSPHSFQIGTSVPGVTLMFVSDMFGLFSDYDDYLGRELSNFSQLLNKRRYHWSEERVWPCISLDYKYRTRNWFSLGVKAGIGWKTRPLRNVLTNEIESRATAIVTSLLFDMRFSYLNREKFTLYSSLGIGAVAYNSTSGSFVLPILDVTWIGFTVGRSFYWFFELGGGATGLLRSGLGVRF